jgi:hypothetical protein
MQHAMPTDKPAMLIIEAVLFFHKLRQAILK